MRHQVFAEDIESGERMEIVLEAGSIAEAEKKALDRGLRAIRVEVEGETPPSRPEPEDSGFDDEPAAPSESKRPAHSNPDGGEEALWSGGPSQLVNFWKYAASIVALVGLLTLAILAPKWVSDREGIVWWAVLPAVGLPLLYVGFVWLRTAVINIDVTNERLRERNGILLRRVEEIELFRVKDMERSQTIVQRLVGLGTLTLHTSDTTRPTMVLNSIRGHETLHDVVRKQVERLRRDRGVREFDMNEAG